MLLKVCKNANLALALLLEVCVLAALLSWGFSTGPTSFTKIALGVGTPGVAMMIWALFGAPNAARRLKGGWYWLLRIVFDAGGGLVLYVAGQHALGVIFALIAAFNCALGSAWKQEYALNLGVHPQVEQTVPWDAQRDGPSAPRVKFSCPKETASL